MHFYLETQKKTISKNNGSCLRIKEKFEKGCRVHPRIREKGKHEPGDFLGQASAQCTSIPVCAPPQKHPSKKSRAGTRSGQSDLRLRAWTTEKTTIVLP